MPLPENFRIRRPKIMSKRAVLKGEFFRRNFTPVLFLALFGFVFLPLTSHCVEIPEMFNYQGLLLDSVGNPLPDGEYGLRFSVYDAEEGGSQLWGPQVCQGVNDPENGLHSKVLVKNGEFHQVMGPKDTDGDEISAAFTSDDTWLQIEVTIDKDGNPVTDGIIKPRQRFLSAPYAFYSRRIPKVDPDLVNNQVKIEDKILVQGQSQNEIAKIGKDSNGAFMNLSDNSANPDIKLRHVPDARMEMYDVNDQLGMLLQALPVGGMLGLFDPTYSGSNPDFIAYHDTNKQPHLIFRNNSQPNKTCMEMKVESDKGVFSMNGPNDAERLKLSVKSDNNPEIKMTNKNNFEMVKLDTTSLSGRMQIKDLNGSTNFTMQILETPLFGGIVYDPQLVIQSYYYPDRQLKLGTFFSMPAIYSTSETNGLYNPIFIALVDNPSIIMKDSNHTDRVRLIVNTDNYGYVIADYKLFCIPHPTKPGYNLIHGSLEGPENGVFYRGEGRMVDREKQIVLPEYFEALTRKEGRTVLLTCKNGWSPIYYEEIVDGKFMVKTTEQGNPAQEFSWEVKAARADGEPLVAEKPQEEMVEGPQGIKMPASRFKELKSKMIKDKK